MVYKTPGIDLFRLAVVLAVSFSSLIFAYNLVLGKNISLSAGMAFIAFLLFILNGLMNAYLFQLREKKNRWLQSVFVYYGISHLLSFLILLFLWPVTVQLISQAKGISLNSKILSILFFNSFMLNSITLFIHYFIAVVQRKATADAENAKLKAANAEGANILLRQQIQPHFLFNALSTLKILYKHNAEAGEEYLIHLAGFLRAAITQNKNQVSKLKDELSFCNDYLAMQQMRFGEALDFEINISEQLLNSGYLPSFSLQLLVENAIKHNDLTLESPIVLVIRELGGWIKVSNNIQPKNYKEDSTGQGLSNLAERYALISGDEVVITVDEKIFSVSIKILKSEYNNN